MRPASATPRASTSTQIGRLYVTQHGRDQLHEDWPELYTAKQGWELPAEEVTILKQGANYGWPYCYYDPDAEEARARARIWRRRRQEGRRVRHARRRRSRRSPRTGRRTT